MTDHTSRPAQEQPDASLSNIADWLEQKGLAGSAKIVREAAAALAAPVQVDGVRDRAIEECAISEIATLTARSRDLEARVGELEAKTSLVAFNEACKRIDVLEAARQIELTEIADKAREWAGFYKEATDGRNTFVLFAEWVEARAALPGGGADR